MVRIVACVALLASTASFAADWPLFRGNPPQTGVSQEPLPDRLDVLWKFEIVDPKAKDKKFPDTYPIEGTAAIADGTVFVGALDEHLYALDLATGKEKWKYKGGYFKAHVSYHDGAVYVGDLDGIFHCVDARKGAKRWTFKTDGEIQSGANFSGEHVLFGSGDEHIYCLDKEGKQVWKFQVPGGPVMGTPAIVKNRTFAAGCDSNLTVLDLAKGKSLGSVDLGGQVGATVAIAGDRLFVGTMSNEVLAVDWNKKEPALAWRFEPEKKQPFYSSAAVTDKYVVIGGRDKNVWCLDHKGQGQWKFPTEGKVDASPVVVGGRVYVGSFDGFFYVIDLEKGTQVQKLNLGSPIGASAAVGSGRLVVGTDKGVVYCLGGKQ
jgi:outer membrane protein assembly factor BamB